MIVISLARFWQNVLLVGKIAAMIPLKTVQFFNSVRERVLYAVIIFFAGLFFIFTEEPYFLFFIISMIVYFGVFYSIAKEVLSRISE